MSGRRAAPTAGKPGPPSPDAADRVAALIGDRSALVRTGGYLNAMGDAGVPRSFPQRAMQSRALPVIYERLWRPLIFGAATIGLSEAAEAELMRTWLELGEGDRVLDVACGPGNTLRRLAPAVGESGLAVGVDAAAGMLAQAVRETDVVQRRTTAYVRADGAALPFPDGAFDAVACFGALYLVDRPFAVLDELVRVLAPGGRIAILTSCHRLPSPLRDVVDLTSRGSGFHWFSRDAITEALAGHGLVDVAQEIHGVMQYVAAIRPVG